MPKFKLKTTGQIEREFEVEADDEAHATKRFTTFKHDPDAFAPGIVTEVKSDKDVSLEKQRIIEITGVAKPAAPVRAVKDKDATDKKQTAGAAA